VSKKCVIVKPRKMRWPRPPRGCRTIEKKTATSTDAAATTSSADTATTTRYLEVEINAVRTQSLHCAGNYSYMLNVLI
jgi:hypothetical protein